MQILKVKPQTVLTRLFVRPVRAIYRIKIYYANSNC
jgi:hypothetical protein